MTKHAIIVLDRASGRVARLRQPDEPPKLRVCRVCRRVHPCVAALCATAA